MKQKTNTINGNADILARQWESGRLARIFASLSPALRKAALMLLLAVMSTTTLAQSTLMLNVDYCKAGVGTIHIAGWVYDNDQNTKKDWWLGHGLDVFAFVSTDPNQVYEGYFPIPNDMEYIVRTDINDTFGLCNEHGFSTFISLNSYINLFEDGEGEVSEKTFYVKIYVRANFGGGSKNYLKHSLAVTVRKNLGYGSEDNPYLIFDADDWNSIADVMADKDIGGYFSDRYYQMSEYYNDETPVTKMFGTATQPFSGHFNGNGQTLNVNLNGDLHVAPFAYTNGATIQDLTVAGTINASQYAGGIVGCAANTLTLQNCVCSATISGFQSYAGGLLGWCDNLTLNMDNCLFKGSFSPGSGGKYHPIALKNADKTVTMPPTITLYYVNTKAPSEELDNNIIAKANGTPVSVSRVDGVWDEPVTATDGQPYYAAHFNGQHLPYEYGFENNDLSADGWALVDSYSYTGILGNFTDYTPHSGDCQFEFCTTSTINHFQYLVSPEFSGSSPILVSFYFKKNPHFRESASCQVGYSTTTPDIDAFTWGETNTSSQHWVWELYEGTFPKGTKYIAIKWLPNYDGYLLIDDFSFTACDTPSPTHLSAIEITEYTASFSWEAPEADKTITGYTYQYKKTSEANWPAETTVDATSVTLTELTANTDYLFRVKALYGVEESVFVPVYFTTAIELPYEWGFENGMGRLSMVNCHEDKTAGYDDPSYTGIRNYAKHEGNYGFYFYGNCSDKWNAQTLISPRFAGTTPLTVSFYFKDSHPDSGRKEVFYVGYSTSTSDPNAFQWSEAIYAQNIPWKRYDNNFPAGTKFIAVKYTSNWNGIYIDDFSVTEYSTFPKPKALTVSNLTDTEATLSWTAPDGNVTGYAYQYRKTTNDAWSAETTVQATTVTLSSLEENTTYNFRVKALGEGGTASNYVSVSFITNGGVVSLPYTDGFEDGMGGWRTIDSDPSTGVITSSNPHGGSQCFHFHRANKLQYLISPHLPSGTPIRMTFYCRNSDPSPDWFTDFKYGYINSNGQTTIGDQWTRISGAQWTTVSYILPADAEYAFICCGEDQDVFYLDDFSFEEVTYIDLDDTADNSTTITDFTGHTVYATLQGRTLYRNGEWNTLCLPFGVGNLSGTPLEGATVKTLGSTNLSNDGTLTLNFEDVNSIEAGKPYILKWDLPKPDLIIHSTADWETFAQNVNNGTESYEGKLVQLATDISISTMAGTADHPFCGTFEGAGYTLNLSISGADYAAPFRYINGATICNVKVTGSVNGGQYSAGIVGAALGGKNSIRNCWMAALVSGQTYVGGILGHGTTSATTISNCFLDGSLNASYIGVLYGGGSNGGTHAVENCWARGTYPTIGDINLVLTDGGTVSVTNCRQNIGDYAQGTPEGTIVVVGEGSINSYFAEFLGGQWALDDNVGLAMSHATDATNITSPVFKKVRVSSTITPVGTDHVNFIGITSPATLAADDGSLLYLDTDKTLHHPDADMTLNACRGYFQLNNPGATINAIVLNFGDIEILLGDVNGDDKVTPADAIMILYHYFGVIQNGFNKSAADLNGDKQVTPADAIEALYKYFGASAGARSSKPANSRDPE